MKKDENQRNAKTEKEWVNGAHIQIHAYFTWPAKRAHKYFCCADREFYFDFLCTKKGLEKDILQVLP